MSHWTSLVEPAALIPKRPQTPAPAVVEKPRKEPKPKVTMQDHLEGRWDRSYRRRVMLLLVKGAMARADFRALAHQMYEGTGPTCVADTIIALIDAGLIVSEVKLTAKGMEKLGLKGAT